FKMNNLTEFRHEFPALKNSVFLDAACVSIMPQRAQEAVDEFTARLVNPVCYGATEHHIWMDQQREAARPEVAAMLGTDSDHVALIESTTHGLNIAAQAIPWQSGDEIVMCNLEFLQVAIPFVKLAERAGVKPVFVDHENGIADVARFKKAVSKRTRAIVVSSTQWSNGYRVDLAGLAELARSVGAWLVVDGIQQAGAIPLEIDGVDFLIAGGHKWLNAPMGMGFMYVSDRVLAELDPPGWGYLALDTPEGGWGRYFTTPEITPDRQYTFPRVAKRFEIGGTGNYPGAIALAKSVQIVNECGLENTASVIWDLGDRLIEGLKKLDLQLETPFPRENRAGIISFSLGNRDRDQACMEFLLDQNIWVAQRYTANTGGVRISVHYFNNESDIDMLLSETARF
ncbi:MAG: aminotransferase class V-fold PLP-dependent enzyme, partial [Pseudomonadales bacterium]